MHAAYDALTGEVALRKQLRPKLLRQAMNKPKARLLVATHPHMCTANSASCMVVARVHCHNREYGVLVQQTKANCL